MDSRKSTLGSPHVPTPDMRFPPRRAVFPVAWTFPVAVAAAEVSLAAASGGTVDLAWKDVHFLASPGTTFTPSTVVARTGTGGPVSGLAVTFTVDGGAAAFAQGRNATAMTGTDGVVAMPSLTSLGPGTVSVTAHAPVPGGTLVTEWQNFIAVTVGAAATPAGQRLVDSAVHQLTTYQETAYVHGIFVDAAAGRYRYDCSGFMDYALGVADPAALAEVPVDPAVGRPRADSYCDFFTSLPRNPTGKWARVDRVADMRPGDVLSWLITPDANTHDTGHCMLVLTEPRPDPVLPGAFEVRVVDSSVSHHRWDSRRSSMTGLGTGSLSLATDGAGAPNGFYWQSGLEPLRPDTIRVGRVLG